MIKKLSLHTPIILLALLLTPGEELPAQEEKAQGQPAPVATEAPAADSVETASPAAQGGKTPEDFKAGDPVHHDVGRP